MRGKRGDIGQRDGEWEMGSGGKGERTCSTECVCV